MAAITVAQAVESALAHYCAGRLAEAEGLGRQILAVQPENADALRVLGLVAASAGRLEEALDLVGRAVALAPRKADFQANLGVLYRRLGRATEAVPCLERAVALDPNSAESHMNLGDALHGAGRYEEAIASSRRALALRPDYAEAQNNLGNALERTGQWDEAQTCFQRAIALRPNFAEAHNSLGHLLLEKGRLEEGLASCERALALNPDLMEAYGNVCNHWAEKGEPHRAFDFLREVIVRRPDYAAAHWNLGLLLLRMERYEEGWKEYEWRWRCPEIAGPRWNFSAPRWDGGPTHGETILVHSEQGFGDVIQFIRYLPLVRERSQAARVYLDCQKELVRLLAQSSTLGAEIVPRTGWDPAALPTFDRHLPLMSLPFALSLFEPLARNGAYLRADLTARTVWRQRLSGTPGCKIGLAWAGNPAHKQDGARSLKSGQLLPLLDVPGVQFYSLQIQSRSNGKDLLLDERLIDLTEHITDFADTAALMAELILIISVDTAAAHLAGALGRPVWTLLPTLPDWRWGLEREDTPWYPTMRLFRQKTAADWEEVIQRVAVELRVLAGTL